MSKFAWRRRLLLGAILGGVSAGYAEIPSSGKAAASGPQIRDLVQVAQRRNVAVLPLLEAYRLYVVNNMAGPEGILPSHRLLRRRSYVLCCISPCTFTTALSSASHSASLVSQPALKRTARSACAPL